MDSIESIVWKYSEKTVLYANDNNIPVLAISGPSGAGKSFLATYLEAKYNEFRIIKNYTTRKKRVSDKGSQFEYISPELFITMQENGKFMLSRHREFPWYGYTNDDFMTIINENKIPIFMFRHSGTKTISRLIKNCYVIVIDTDVNTSAIHSKDEGHLTTVESSMRSYASINHSVNQLRTDHVLRLYNDYSETIVNSTDLNLFLQRIINDRR